MKYILNLFLNDVCDFKSYIEILDYSIDIKLIIKLHTIYYEELKRIMTEIKINIK